MTNKVIRGKSRYGEFLSDKSRFMAQEDSKSNQKKKGKQRPNKKKWSLSIIKQTY